MTTLQVGQQLWLVSRHRDQSRYVTVAKIGRKWATLAGNAGRVDLETLALDGGRYSSPGQCYESREGYVAECQRRNAWRALQRDVWYMLSPQSAGITVDQIREARRVLGIAATDTEGAP